MMKTTKGGVSLDKPKIKYFYRIQKSNNEGVWYNAQRVPVNPQLHLKMPMPIDINHYGYVSAVESLENFYQYFGTKLLEDLEKEGYELVRISTPNFKRYNGYILIPENDEYIFYEKL